jgi:hypothetical protein
VNEPTAGDTLVVEPEEAPSEPVRDFNSFRWHRILHGGKEICQILNAYKKVYNLVHWDFEPNGNQFILVVELEEK